MSPRRPEASDHYRDGEPIVTSSRAAEQAHRMTEDELMGGLMECLSLGGWRWTHIRDSRGITQGFEGLPDLFAVHPDVDEALLWECKSDSGRLTPEQAAWLQVGRGRVIDSRIIRPTDYDHAIRLILGAPARRRLGA